MEKVQIRPFFRGIEIFIVLVAGVLGMLAGRSYGFQSEGSLSALYAIAGFVLGTILMIILLRLVTRRS